MSVGLEKPETKAYILLPDWGYTNAAFDTSLTRLIMAVIGQAAKDARARHRIGQDARLWLLSRACSEMCDYIGLDFAPVREWVNSGCPDWDTKREVYK